MASGTAASVQLYETGLQGLVRNMNLDVWCTLEQLNQTSSNLRFGRHETGSAIHWLMSDSCQPLPLTLILICGGNVPSAILRYMVDRDSPVRESTVLKRMIRSGSRITALPPAGCL